MAEPCCGACKKAQSALGSPSNTCSRCRTERYCTKRCQKSDWKEHKKTCTPAPPASDDDDDEDLDSDDDRDYRTIVNMPMGLDMPNFFLKELLEMGTDRPQQTYVVIIKLSAQDRYDKGLVLTDEEDLKEHQRGFLKKLERHELLPTWWNEEHVKGCEDLSKIWIWATKEDKSGGKIHCSNKDIEAKNAAERLRLIAT